MGLGVGGGGREAGEKTAILAADRERVDWVHNAQDRRLVPAGAGRAALWARGKPPGFYDRQDVLGLKD